MLLHVAKKRANAAITGAGIPDGGGGGGDTPSPRRRQRAHVPGSSVAQATDAMPPAKHRPVTEASSGGGGDSGDSSGGGGGDDGGGGSDGGGGGGGGDGRGGSARDEKAIKNDRVRTWPRISVRTRFARECGRSPPTKPKPDVMNELLLQLNALRLENKSLKNKLTNAKFVLAEAERAQAAGKAPGRAEPADGGGGGGGGGDGGDGGGGDDIDEDDDDTIFLPDGWEETKDASGRSFFINAATKTITPEDPRGPGAAAEAAPCREPPSASDAIEALSARLKALGAAEDPDSGDDDDPEAADKQAQENKATKQPASEVRDKRGIKINGRFYPKYDRSNPSCPWTDPNVSASELPAFDPASHAALPTSAERDFLKSIIEDGDKIGQLYKRRDFHEVAKLGHKLRKSASEIGAVALQRAVSDLEMLANEGAAKKASGGHPPLLKSIALFDKERVRYVRDFRRRHGYNIPLPIKRAPCYNADGGGNKRKAIQRYSPRAPSDDVAAAGGGGGGGDDGTSWWPMTGDEDDEERRYFVRTRTRGHPPLIQQARTYRLPFIAFLRSRRLRSVGIDPYLHSIATLRRFGVVLHKESAP